MSDLFRKEALSRRSRALFGDVLLRSPLSNWIVILLIVAAAALIGFILLGVSIEGQTVIEWMSRDR